MGFFSGFASGFGENIKGAGEAYANARWQARRRAEDRAIKEEDEKRRRGEKLDDSLTSAGVGTSDIMTSLGEGGNKDFNQFLQQAVTPDSEAMENAKRGALARVSSTEYRQETEDIRDARRQGFDAGRDGGVLGVPDQGVDDYREYQETKRKDETAIRKQNLASSSAEQASLKRDYDDAQSDTYGIIDAVIITQDDNGNDIYQKGKGYDIYINAKKENARRTNEIADLRLKTALQKYEDDRGDKADALKGFYARTLVEIQDFASKGKAISEPDNFKRTKDKFGNFYHIMITAKQLMDDINEGTVSGDRLVKRVSALDKLWVDFQFNKRQSGMSMQRNEQWKKGSSIYDGAIYPNLLEDSEEPKGLYDENNNIVTMTDDEIKNRPDITLSFLKDYEERIKRELDLLVEQRQQALDQQAGPEAIASIDSAYAPLRSTLETIKLRKKALNSSAGMFN